MTSANLSSSNCDHLFDQILEQLGVEEFLRKIDEIKALATDTEPHYLTIQERNKDSMDSINGKVLMYLCDPNSSQGYYTDPISHQMNSLFKLLQIKQKDRGLRGITYSKEDEYLHLSGFDETKWRCRQIYMETNFQERPQLSLLLKDIKRGDVVVTSTVKNYGSDSFAITLMGRKIRGAGAKLIALDCPIDTDTTYGEFFFGICGSYVTMDINKELRSLEEQIEGKTSAPA